MKHNLLILSLVLLGACGDGKKDVADGQALADKNVNGLTVDLGKWDMPLIVDLGDGSTLGVDTPTVRWNESSGGCRSQEANFRTYHFRRTRFCPV